MRSSIKRVMVFALTLCMLLSFVTPFGIDVFAADSYTFDFTKDSPVIVINQALIDSKGTSNFVIPDGAYSVTVNGDIEVNIIFDNVTINRYESVSKEYYSITDGATAAQLYAAGDQLGWTRAGGGVYVPTVPFLITGGAKVNARFDGECVFRAGTNGWYVSNSGSEFSELYETWAYYGGYAGIQVDSGASLTIIGADNLYAFGAYQYYGKDIGVPTTPEEMLAAAIAGTPIFEVGAEYEGPTGYKDQENGGGAGIGGGTSYNTSVITSGGSYTVGTPGEIIINGGYITAVGGHTAAGIGGGVNSAATSSQIVINAGNVTAVGGRFAAGIGDGDSTNNKESDTFSNSYHIEINGGTVKAYGGTASAGIGTTDNVTILNGGAEGKTSGLSITLNGGDITAQSGEPEGANEATAAIGSGKNTDMADNSITVNSAAYVSAASFSKYAISNKGTNIDEAPSIIVDPNGYIYFIRFAENTDQRTFKLYPVKRDKLGNPMLVNTTASDLLDGNINSPTYSAGTRDKEGEIRYYACDSEQGEYYRVDEYGNPLRVKPGHDNDTVIENSDLQITQDKGSIYYPNPNIESLTYYYYDTNNPIRTYTVPGNYKAVAISLPLPELYGGRYVLHAPYRDASAKDDDIYALIKKTESGPNSSELHDGTEDYPIYQTHVPFGPNSTNYETPNMSVDPTAGSFLDIDVFKYNSDNTLDSYDYIGDDVFSRGTYGYTVYMPTGTEKVHIDLYFSNTETTDEGKTTTYESLDYIGDAVSNYKVEQTAADPITYTAECDVDITSGYEVVWFKKTDKTTDINGEEITVTVTYRIVIVVKPEYEFGIADMDKTYDGAAVSAEVNGMFMYSFTGDDPTQYDAGISIEQDTNDIASYTYTYGRYDFNVQVAKESTGTDDDGQHYIQYTTLISYGDQQISVNTKYYITGKYVQEIPNDNYFEIGWSWSRSRYYIVANENDRSIGIKRGQDGTVYNIVDFNYFNLVSSTYDLSDLDKAREDLKNAGIIGGEEAYEVYRKDNYIVTIKQYSSNYDNTPEEIERKFNIILTVNGTVTYNKEDISSILTDEDRNSINYTYYSYDDADGNGTYDEGEATTLLSSAPKDAGTYFVVAELETKKYEAYGMKCFTISKREIKIVSIQNWHTTVKDLAEFNQTIGNPGTIYFDDVIQGDTVTLDEDADGYTVAYDDKTIGYSDVKIKITNPVLSAESGKNYVLTGYETDSGNYYYLVPGQISYDTTGAMFKKTENGPWRKFFPTTEDTYLIFDSTDERVDYHSPSSTEHLEYIKARTIGSGERGAKYAVDIEYGNMEFTYSKTVWDVNNHRYEDVPDDSRWGGFDNTNNKITIKNRSNREVEFSIESGIDFLYQMQGDSGMGIESILYHYPKGEKTAIEQPEQTETPQIFTVDKATPPEGEETQGTAGEYYVTLELKGTPQIGASDEFTTVGWITVTILKTTTTNTP